MTEIETTRAPSSGGADYRGLAHFGRGLGLAGALAAAALFFAAVPPLDLGVFDRLESVAIAMFAAGALCAAGLALAGPRALARAWRAPLFLPFAAVGVWSLALAPFAEFPWRSVLGPPQTGLGALALLAFAAFAGAIAAFAGVRARAALAWALVAGAVVAAISHFLPAPWQPFDLPSFHAWLGLAALAGALAARGGRALTTAGIAAAVLALAVAENKTAIALTLAVGVPIFVATRRLRGWGHLRAAGVALVLLLAPLANAVAWLAGDARVWDSILARTRTFNVMAAAIAEQPTILLFGAGWGGYVEAFVRHLPSGADLLYGESWDVAVRELQGIHSLPLEFWISAGIPGLLLVLGLPALTIARARTKDLPLAVAFGAVFVGLSALWQQAGYTAAPMAIVFAMLARKSLRMPDMPTPVFRAVAAGACVGLLVGASWLADFGWRARTALAGVATDPCLENFPDDSARGDFSLRDVVTRRLRFVAIGRLGPDDPVLRAAGCALDRRFARAPSVHLAIAGALHRASLGMDPAFAGIAAADSARLAMWPDYVAGILRFAPRRTDLVAPYLASLALKEDWSGLRAVSASILDQAPLDPVGMWFSGTAMIRAGTPEAQVAGRARLRRALELGFTRFIPLPDELVNELRRQ